MHLIFAYIEKFRNIERQQYCFDKSYEVNLCEKEKSRYKIDISQKKDCLNIMKKNNVENITVVVGRNGSGKTSWIVAMSELLESFNESAFIFIYVDGDDFYVEYNRVWIMDLQGEYYGWDDNEASICKVNYEKNTFEMLEKNKPRNDKIAYICQICNSRLKLDKDFLLQEHVYPYTESFSYDGRFVIDNIDFLYGEKPRYSIHVFENSALKEKICHSVETFKINELYENHTDYVEEIILKAQIYSSSQFDEFIENFSNMFESKENLKRLVFGNYIMQYDQDKRPLAKLTQDILNDLGIHDF